MTTKISNKIKIGIADDQKLFLKSLETLINTFLEFEVVLTAFDGEQLVRQVRQMAEVPSLLLVDVTMPVLDGAKAVEIISRDFPGIYCVALSAKDDDDSVLKMIRAGCCAYFVKDVNPDVLEIALKSVYEKGYYNSDAANIRYRKLLMNYQREPQIKFNDRELNFLRLACSDLTYKEIAAQMFLSERTIDSYRECLFEKLNVKSRVGMALEAVRLNLVSL